MPKQIRMPKLSDTMEEGTLLAWRKREGDTIERGEILADIETDPETLIEGIMAIQRIVDVEGIKASGERGKGLGLVAEPRYQVAVAGEGSE